MRWSGISNPLFSVACRFTSPFTADRRKTPALTYHTATQPFEFVLVNAPGYCFRTADVSTDSDDFTRDDTRQGVVMFQNLL